MYCKNCGHELPDDAQFCQQCGTKTDQPAAGSGMIENTTQTIGSLPDTGLPNTGQTSGSLPNTGLPNTAQPSGGLPNNGLPSPGFPNPGPPTAQYAAPVKQSGGKGLKVTFFLLLGLATVLFVALLLSPGGSDDATVKAILEQEPKVDMAEIAGWGKGAFSLGSIGNAAQTDVSGYMGVWSVTGKKASPTDEAYTEEFDPSGGAIYVAIDEDTVHSITQFPDGAIASHEMSAYRQENGYLVAEAPQGAVPDSILRFEILDGQLVGANYLDDTQLTDCVIYEKTDIPIEDLLDAPHLQDTEAMPEEPEEPEEPQADSQSYDIEAQILGAWENDYEDAYYGCEFYDDGTFLYIEQYGDDDAYYTYFQYRFTDGNTMIIDEDPASTLTVSIDYEFGEHYLILDDGESFTELFQVDALRVSP